MVKLFHRHQWELHTFSYGTWEQCTTCYNRRQRPKQHKAKTPFWQTWPALIMMAITATAIMVGLGLLNVVTGR